MNGELDDKALEGLYGPLYRFSDHKKGQRITYRDEGSNQTGVILWVVAPGPIAEGRQMGMHYIVGNDYHAWPDVVFPGDVVQERSS